MIKPLPLLFYLIFSFQATAQNEGFYRSRENPYYWKNRPPVPGYWQQDVHYKIRAEINDLHDYIEGTEELTYWNNSPDTLHFVYFHLFQNAFQPGSYLHQLTQANGIEPAYSHWEKEKKGIEILRLQSEGKDLRSETDNTVLKVWLGSPLLPGNAVMFAIGFKTYYGSGSTRRRMQLFTSWGHKHFNGAQWYPKISVYDHKFGWTADQHMNKEFYGDFGTFDVDLTVPDIYIVDATGILVNEKEMLPDSLRKALDLSNFKNKQFGSPPSMPVQPAGQKKTWKFHAENVHDFAFTAGPTYRIGEAEATLGDGTKIRCFALAQESHASRWQNAAAYTARLIETYSKNVGPYAWPKVTVCDARDGMEFPMITLDGGVDPTYRELLAHENAHQWFYGMVGSNETYRAFLDEGFSQFIHAQCMEEIEGRWGLNPRSRSKYTERFRDSISVPYRVAYQNYLNEAVKRSEIFLNTHSDNFNSALGHGGGYSMVYRKTATMLYNLQYVLGDSLFKAALQNYFSQWKFCHPYPEDMRNSFIRFTKVDLNWFFDQWLETSKRLDYSIRSVRGTREKDRYVIRFRRKERMESPVDFSIYARDGRVYNYHIPNRNFIRKTNAEVLPRWYGWDKLNPEYRATVSVPSGIERIVIDTTFRLADVNMLNNARPFPVHMKFDSRIASPAKWEAYVIRWRPDVWYNNYDGVKAGVHLEGNYFNYAAVFDFNFWLNSGLAQRHVPESAPVNKNDPVSLTLSFRTPAEKILKGSAVSVKTRILDGWQYFSGGIDWNTASKNATLSFAFTSSYRADVASIAYLLYPEEWGVGSYDNVLHASAVWRYSGSASDGSFKIHLRSSSLGSSYDYSYLTLTGRDDLSFGRFTLRSRILMQYGTGTDYASESALFLAGANGEELMNDKFTRSRAYVPEEWLGYGIEPNHFHHGGGLNLRGYSGYLVVQEAGPGTIRFIYKGSTGWSVNEELEFGRYLPVRPRVTRNWLGINLYLFGDIGSINYDLEGEDLLMSDIRADAGIGITATIKKFFALQMVKPFTIRADFPLWLNRPAAVEGEFVKFRYVIGIGRSF